MICIKVQIINKLGLHARAAAKFVSTASSFSSTIKVQYNGKSVDGKSIMSIMMLAASKGSELTLEVDGADEKSAADALQALVDDYFGEGE